jgi:hypothetical protein
MEVSESPLYSKKWVANYAQNGLSLCKDLHCLYGDKKIPKGSLRIGRRYPSPFDPESVAINWFHAKCMFNQQSRSRVGTQIIGQIDEIDGIDDILLADKELIEELIQGNIELIATTEPPSGRSTTDNTPRLSLVKAKKKGGSTLSGTDDKNRRVSINRRDAGRVLLL